MTLPEITYVHTFYSAIWPLEMKTEAIHREMAHIVTMAQSLSVSPVVFHWCPFKSREANYCLDRQFHSSYFFFSSPLLSSRTLSFREARAILHLTVRSLGLLRWPATTVYT